MARQRSVKRKVIPSPKSLEEASEWLRELGEHMRAIDAINDGLNSNVSALTTQATAQTKPHSDRITEIRDGLFVFAEARRAELTAKGKKTISVPTGEFGWRETPPKVNLKSVKAVLAALKKLGLDRFIRRKDPEVNKEAMLREPDVARNVPGVSISQEEVFFATPAEVAAEIVETTDKPRKAVA